MTSFGPGPSGPPVQSMGGRGCSTFMFGVWRELGRGGHTDACHVWELEFSASPRWEYCFITGGGNPPTPFLAAAAPTFWPSADHPDANVYVDSGGAWRAFTGEVASELRSARPEPRTADEAQAELASALGRVLRRRMGLEG